MVVAQSPWTLPTQFHITLIQTRFAYISVVHIVVEKAPSKKAAPPYPIVPELAISFFFNGALSVTKQRSAQS